jgi:hypothetical protein
LFQNNLTKNSIFSYYIFDRFIDEFIEVVPLSNINYKYENGEIVYLIRKKMNLKSNANTLFKCIYIKFKKWYNEKNIKRGK